MRPELQCNIYNVQPTPGGHLEKWRKYIHKDLFIRPKKEVTHFQLKITQNKRQIPVFLLSELNLAFFKNGKIT